MSFLSFTRWAFRVACGSTLISLAVSIYAWARSLFEVEFWLGVFAMKAGLLAMAGVAAVRLFSTVVGIDGVEDRRTEGLLWGGALVGAGFGVPAVMGGWMFILGYPNWERFLAIGALGLLFAGAIAGVGVSRR